ncbi:MAG: DinB family protein [Acidobacteria bacterium]|nr:DinB family protein [Acidobacteriota bacterium]
MERRTTLAALVAGFAANSATFTNPFAQAFLKSFVDHWKDTREYTLAVLDAMPADKFTSKANPAQRTFGEQLLHIASANTAYFRGFTLVPPPDMKTPDASDKVAVRAFVAAGFDFVESVLARMTEKDVLRTDIKFSPRLPAHSAVDIFLRAYMHTAHHRGQIITYLRVSEITPPTWKFEPHA